MTVPAVPRAIADRLSPALATVGLIVIGMAAATWWGPAIAGKTAWTLPEDLWGTLVAAQRLIHLNIAGLYTQPTGLITFPGAAIILAPIVAVTDAADLSLAIPGAQNPQPVVWLIAGPYEIIVSAVALFAADALARRLGTSGPKRMVLAGAGAVALWNVSVQWGHPEDPVAVGLFLFGVLALADGRLKKSAWLTGAAVAVQPLVLLALPVVAVLIERRRLPGYLARAAIPAGLLLAAAAWANWHATIGAVTSQPNSPTINHPTPWTSFAPHLSDGTVAAGPARALTILAACACALIAKRRWRPAAGGPGPSEPVPSEPVVSTGDTPTGNTPTGNPATGNPATGDAVSPQASTAVRWDNTTLAGLLWWIAVTLALRSVFEPVMVAYYVWPVLQVALITAAGSWPRLIATSVTTTTTTFASQLTWQGPWTWWTPMIAGLCLTLAFARVKAQPPQAPPAATEQLSPSVSAQGGDPLESPQEPPPPTATPLAAEQAGRMDHGIGQHQVSGVP